MSDAVEIWEQPQAKTIYMLAGWRQWADAGSISSALPQYLIQQMDAKKIGRIRSDGFYLFQIPGTHDLVRPIVNFKDGYPKSLDVSKNELFYSDQGDYGIVFFLGDEPHLDMERYSETFLYAAKTLNVKRIVSFGGVYGEFPYDKERMVSGMYSLRSMKPEFDKLSVNLSDYHGGASVGSYLCRRAGDKNMEYVGLYAFSPTYDLSKFAHIGNTIRVENDFMAWRGVLQRVNFMLGIHIDLSDLEQKCENLISTIDEKVDEYDSRDPQLGVKEYFDKLSDEFTEVHFAPLGDVWESELRRLLDESDSDE